MAVLEAFVYDPLINWRLLATPNAPKGAEEQPPPFESAPPPDPLSPSTGPQQQQHQQQGAQEEGDGEGFAEQLNERALTVVDRISKKLTGRDFSQPYEKTPQSLSVPDQVDRLITQATSIENLCQSMPSLSLFFFPLSFF
jgi:FKBP12-rapamycin complex-associated protein